MLYILYNAYLPAVVNFIYLDEPEPEASEHFFWFFCFILYIFSSVA